MTWPTKKLVEVCEKLKIEKALIGTTPYIEIGDVDVETKVINHKEKGAVKGSIFAPPSCVIVSRVRPTRGAASLLDKRIAISSAFTILKPKPNLDLKFLFYYLAYNSKFFEYLGQRQKGSNYPSCREKDILNYEIPLPSIKIQKQIVARIEKLFEKIDKLKELRQKAQEETEQIFQSALQEVFSKVRKKYKIKEFTKCIDRLPKQIKGIPRRKYQEKGQFPIIDQGEILIGGYTNDKSKIYQGKLPVIIFGDHTRIFKYIDFPFTIGADGTKIIIPRKEFCPKFFYYALRNLNIESLGYSRHYKVLKIKKLPLPSLSEQKKIVAELDNLREKVERLKQLQQTQLEELNSLKQSILAKAFKGELISEEQKVIVPKINIFKLQQAIGAILQKIERGEMVVAKILYFAQEIYKVPLGFNFSPQNLGPYDQLVKKAITAGSSQRNRFFYRKKAGNNYVYALGTNSGKLFQYSNSKILRGMISALNDLVPYLTNAKSSDIERLATVCKIIQDIKSSDLEVIEVELTKWKPNKFSKQEIEKTLNFIKLKKWDNELIKE